MALFLAAIALLLLSALAGGFVRQEAPGRERLSLALALSGCGLGAVAVIFCLLHPESAVFAARWPVVPGAAIAFKIDHLAAVFLFPALLIAAAGSLYAAGYWPVDGKHSGGVWLRVFYPLLTAAILLLLASDNAVLFLLFWEIMAISGFLLVITERQKEEAHRAGFVYLAATHTATLALFGLFALVMQADGGVRLPAAASLAGGAWPATPVFLLALLGFGLKAGLIPLHIWLPSAHANAPSNVSALMSGVMIKLGIYGIVRTTSFFHDIPAWWGQTVLVLGLVSAVLGVALAIAQHDIKRLLAYHSVENIGIILIGLGVALLGRARGDAAMAALGLGGALLHVINHGLFKALLFLAAGSVSHRLGSRQLGDYGGVLKFMPCTGLFFLGGAVSICGLPPLNGFVSEWLVYLGIFSLLKDGSPLLGLVAAPGLALTGGLALLCFAKVFGCAFLGAPRRGRPPEQGESPRSMLIPMAMLFAACLWIGVAPFTLLPFLAGAIADWSGQAMPATGLAELAPAGWVGLAALGLVLSVGAGGVIIYRRRPLHDRSQPTWGCGYARPIQRAQYTASSFAQMLGDLFRWALWTKRQEEKPRGILPANQASYESHTPDPLLDRLLLPLFASIAGAAAQLRHLLQHGVIGLYLLNSMIALAVLLLLALF